MSNGAFSPGVSDTTTDARDTSPEKERIATGEPTEKKRIGHEKERIGYEKERIGYEKERIGHAGGPIPAERVQGLEFGV